MNKLETDLSSRGLSGRISSVRAITGGAAPAVGIVAICVCVFTLSWDRVAVFQIAGANLKLAIAAGLVATVASMFPSAYPAEKTRGNALFWLGALFLLYMIVRGFFVGEPRAAASELVEMALKLLIVWGAVRTLRTRRILTLVLSAFIWGGVAAAVFGLYQLAAFYAGWPQVVSYDGLGGDGGLGRIASFSYEPAYFGYFLLLVLGAIYARARLTGRQVPILTLAVILVTILLVNSRGAYILLPVVLLVAAVWDRRVMSRRRQLGVVVALFVAGIASVVLAPAAWSKILGWIASSLDPSEPTSNAVRLDLYEAATTVIAHSPIWGVGPGQFYSTATALGLYPAGDTAQAATANNNWLQALLDGGIPALLLLVALIVAVAVRYVALGSPATRTLALTYLAVLLVAGMLVSNLFDMKMLIFIAFVVSIDRFAHDDASRGADLDDAHIVLDARAISSSTGRYMERILHHLQLRNERTRYTVLVAKEGDWHPSSDRFTPVVADFAPHSLSEQWGLYRLLARMRPDLVHFMMPEQPVLFTGRKVTTVHDLNLLRIRNPRHSAFRGWLKRAVGRVIMRSVIRRSSEVIVPSTHTLDDVARVSGRPAPEITLVYEAAEVEAEVVQDGEAKYPVPFDAYLLYVGSQLEYKNIRRLAQAHQHLRRDHPNLGLVIVGRLDQNAEMVRTEFQDAAFEGIHFTGFLSDAQRDSLYQGCACYVFPSYMEGFGLPGLEAMLRGAPVAAAKAASLPEVYGEAAEYFDPYDVESMGSAIQRVIESPGRADQLRALGHRRVGEFSWARATDETVVLYRDALAGHAKFGRVASHDI